ncbi:MAG TPA: excisionase family DNA-binding protein [Thermomicrobiales bacterium]|nr:excisionase family DNA-binding protein [Thermomicrobiales bacterium]
MTTQLQPEPPVLVTVEEAARRLSIGRTATYMLVLKGELQSVKIGRTRRVVVASIDDYVSKLLQQTHR